MRYRSIFAYAFIASIGILLAAAPKTFGDEQSIDDFIVVLGDMVGVSSRATSELVAPALENPETINKVMKQYLVGPSGWRLLKNLDVRFKTFRVHGDSTATALGFSYSFSKDVRKQFLEKKTCKQSGISLSLSAKGNVAFDEKANPADFLESDLALHLFRSYGGVIEVADSVTQRLYELTAELADIENQDSLDNDPRWKEVFMTAMASLTTQVYLDLSLSGGLESNQAFTQKNYVYAAKLGIDVKPWNRQSFLAQWNLFDWPFAALRWLSETDESFTPRGSSFPTVLFGLSYVEPETDNLRAAAGETSGYPRFDAEAAFKTLVMDSPAQRVFFSADVRYCRQLSALSAIRQADIEERVYSAAALHTSSGLFVGYSTGRLPFDATDDQVFELGFQLGFF